LTNEGRINHPESETCPAHEQKPGKKNSVSQYLRKMLIIIYIKHYVDKSSTGVVFLDDQTIPYPEYKPG